MEVYPTNRQVFTKATVGIAMVSEPKKRKPGWPKIARN